LEVNLGHPIATNGILCVRGSDAALPKLHWDFLFKDKNVLYMLNLTVDSNLFHIL